MEGGGIGVCDFGGVVLNLCGMKLVCGGGGGGDCLCRWHRWEERLCRIVRWLCGWPSQWRGSSGTWCQRQSRWSPGRIVVEVRRALEVGCHVKRASKCWYRRVQRCRSHSPAWCSGRRAVRLCRWDALGKLRDVVLGRHDQCRTRARRDR